MEYLLHVYVPGPAERLQLCWCSGGQRAGAGREHEHPRLVLVDELAGRYRVSRVRFDRREAVPELGLQFGEPAAVAGDAGHGRARLGQGRRDAPAESFAGPGDEGTGSGELVC